MLQQYNYVILHYVTVITLCYIAVMSCYGTLNLRDYTGVNPSNRSFKHGKHK